MTDTSPTPAPAPAAAEPEAPIRPRISISKGFGEWLRTNEVSLAASTYQTGQLFLMGVRTDGQVNVDWSNFSHATGLAWDERGLWIGTLYQIWRLESLPKPIYNDFDVTLVPRSARTIGRIEVHDFGVDKKGRLIFANTAFSCLSTLHPRDNFRPIWKPPFISELLAEDRCHLNGLAMRDRGPAYVSAVSQSDHRQGWRELREGLIIDVPTSEVVAEGFRMPHSPRVYDGRLFALDSGRGRLVEVDVATGKIEEILFCPGFLRGLAFHNGYAIIGSSKPRHKLFGGLPIQDELDKRKEEPWCGIFVVDLKSGTIAEWLRFDTMISEMFDVVTLPGIRCPGAIDTTSKQIQEVVTFPNDIGPLE
jgi:uncharacterized protein (TIGR03032 family)